MGKKPAGKAKAKASAGYKEEKPVEAEPEMTAEQMEARRLFTQRREGGKWCEAQLAVVWQLCETAKDLAKAKGIGSYDWLTSAHEFHQKKLVRAQQRLKNKELDGIPQELKDGVEAYFAQFRGEKKSDIDPADLKETKEVWQLVEEEVITFTRAAETADSTAAIEKLKEWTECSVADMEKFTNLLKANISSGGAQETGFERIGWLCTDAAKKAEEKVAVPAGLTVNIILPALKLGMEKHLADQGVQRAGCAALRGLTNIDGQLTYLCDQGGPELAVASLNAHYTNKEVAQTANGFFWAGGQKAGKNSAENARMRHAGAIEALAKVMTHWAWDQTLVGRIRVTLPFLTED